MTGDEKNADSAGREVKIIPPRSMQRHSLLQLSCVMCFGFFDCLVEFSAFQISEKLIQTIGHGKLSGLFIPIPPIGFFVGEICKRERQRKYMSQFQKYWLI